MWNKHVPLRVCSTAMPACKWYRSRIWIGSNSSNHDVYWAKIMKTDNKLTSCMSTRPRFVTILYSWWRRIIGGSWLSNFFNGNRSRRQSRAARVLLTTCSAVNNKFTIVNTIRKQQQHTYKLHTSNTLYIAMWKKKKILTISLTNANDFLGSTVILR